MAQVEPTATMIVVGAELHMQADSEADITRVLSKTCAAFHARVQMWWTRGTSHAKLRTLVGLRVLCACQRYTTADRRGSYTE